MNNTGSSEVVVVQSNVFSQFPQLVFGMSTRMGGVSPEPLGMNLSFGVGDVPKNVEINRSRFFEKLGITGDRLSLPKQIHSNTITKASGPGLYPDCDALMTDTHGLFLGVSVADCVPIFLFDPVTASLATVHSGWRGSKARILENALTALSREFEAKPKDVLAYIGPSASACCYEVGEEVASSFDESFVRRLPEKKPHLDLKEFNQHLLIGKGVREDHIEVSNDCTICNKLYHSFRRDGSRSGRMYGVIGVR